MKTMTRKQLEARKARAVRFALDVLDKPERADEIENQTLEEYAESRHIQIKNPRGAKAVAVPTRRELMDRIKELEEENENRNKLGKPRVSLEEWKKMRSKRKKPLEP